MIGSIVIYSIPSILIISGKLIGSLTCKKLDETTLKFFVYLLFFYLFFISAFRFDVGTDYKHWEQMFNIINQGYSTYVEVLYIYLNKLLGSLFGFSSRSLFIFSSFIICSSYQYVIVKLMPKEYWLLGTYLFINLGCFFMSMNLVRQYIAIALICYTIPQLKNEKYMKLIVSVSVACFLHSTACIYFIAILGFILYRRLKTETQTRLLFILLVVSICLMMFDFRQYLYLFSKIIPDRFEMFYLSEGNKYFIQRNVSAILKQFVPNIIILFLLWIKSKKSLSFIDEVSLFGAFCYVLLTNLFCGMMAFIRLAYFFEIFFILITPLLINYFSKGKAKVIIFFYIVYYAILTIITIYIMRGCGVMPYYFLTY